MSYPVARMLAPLVVLAAAALLPAPSPAQTAPDRASSISHYLQGRLFEEGGQDMDALEEYQRALQLDPGAAGIELRVSEISSRLGEARRSLEYARRALDHDPGNARALWLEGSALFNLEQPDSALEVLQAAAAADTEQVEYLKTLAHVAELEDRIDLVDSSWRRVLDLDDEDGEAWFQLAAAEARLGHFKDADSLLDEANALNPARPGTLFLKGWIEENLGQPAEAMRYYRHHLELHPGDQTTRRRLVNLLVDGGRYAEAYREASVVTAAQPEDPEALEVEADLAMRLGHNESADALLARLEGGDPADPERVGRASAVLARRGRTREAVAHAQGWADGHPADFRGAMLLAQARSLGGDVDGAVGDARRAVAMVPDSLAPRLMLGGILQAKKRYAAAESVWAETARRFPSRSRVQLDQAYCREQLGDLDGAVAVARDVLSRQPANADALNFVGYLYADHSRNLAEAEDLVRRALEVEPDNGAYLDSMGWVHFRLGRLAQARQELERAVQLTNGDPVVREHLGDVYNDLRLFDLARVQYRLSLARDRENERVRTKLARLH